jgi:hypothetical protein
MSERTGPGGPPRERQRARSLGAEGGPNSAMSARAKSRVKR